MPPRSRNEHLVPDADKPYYRNATVPGLRQQLDDEGLNTDGLKYDLYLRLTNAGFRLYTDDRPSSDEEGSDDGSDNESDDGNDDGNDDQRRGVIRRPAQGSNAKRPRDPSPSDESDDGGDPQPPPRRRRGLALPVELRIPVVQNLHPAALWNLIDSAPEDYLNGEPLGGINVLIIEARGQYALDYPPPRPVPSPPPQPQGDGADDGGGAPETPPASGGPGSGDNGSADDGSADNGSADNGSGDNRPDDPANDDDDAPRTMSLLEWVAIRATYDSRFRTTNRMRINRVIDAYLMVYGPNDPAPGNENTQDDILYYFRDRNDIQNPEPGIAAHTPLTLAAFYNNPFIVQLLLLRGTPVDQSLRGWTPLDRAMRGIPELSINTAHGIQCVFTLIGSGANLGILRQPTQRASFNLLMAFQEFDDDQIDIFHPPQEWPKIDNPLALGIREFIADERSSYWDRVLLSFYVIWAGTIDYPLFI